MARNPGGGTPSGATGDGGSPVSFDDIAFIDPVTDGPAGTGTGTGTGSPTDGSGGKRKGRPPGSKNRANNGGSQATAQATTIRAENLTPYIMAFHMMFAQRLPEMAITVDEAKQLSVALANYLRHSNAVVSQKTVDTLVLIGAVGMIEGTRIFAIASRKRAEKAGRPPNAHANVVPIDPSKFPFVN